MAPIEAAPGEPPAIDGAAPATRALRPDDARLLVRLSAEAGWNQTEDDWRLILDMGQGEGVFGADGAPVASACTVPLTRRAHWVCMVLVTADARRRGLATRLMRARIQAIRDQGLVAGLDATELGRPVYEPLGFRALFGLDRLVATDPRIAAPAPAGTAVRAVAEDDLDRLAAYDTDAVGAVRAPLLRHLARRLPAAALVAERRGRIVGFALGRDGRLGCSIGPLVADDDAVAAALAAGAATATGGTIVVDAAHRDDRFTRALATAGFVRQRGFTRMSLGDDPALSLTRRLFAVTGPEFG